MSNPGAQELYRRLARSLTRNKRADAKELRAEQQFLEKLAKLTGSTSEVRQESRKEIGK